MFPASSDNQIAEWTNRYFHYSEFPDTDMSDFVKALDAGYWWWTGNNYQSESAIRKQILSATKRRYPRTRARAKELLDIPYFRERRIVPCQLCKAKFFSTRANHIFCDQYDCSQLRKWRARRDPHVKIELRQKRRAEQTITMFLYGRFATKPNILKPKLIQ